MGPDLLLGDPQGQGPGVGLGTGADQGQGHGGSVQGPDQGQALPVAGAQQRLALPARGPDRRGGMDDGQGAQLEGRGQDSPAVVQPGQRRAVPGQLRSGQMVDLPVQATAAAVVRVGGIDDQPGADPGHVPLQDGKRHERSLPSFFIL